VSLILLQLVGGYHCDFCTGAAASNTTCSSAFDFDLPHTSGYVNLMLLHHVIIHCNSPAGAAA
jgi:hypothetical protein